MSDISGVIKSGLSLKFDGKLVDELLEAHAEAHRNFYLGGLRLCEVAGGRFCEAAFRMLEQTTTGNFTPLNAQVDTEKLIRQLANLPASQAFDSVRLHIPRSLRVVYDIRNKRDAAHLGDGIDPNVQDSTLVISVADWVLAEFVRLSHSVPADEAQRMVEGIVSRRAPAIQDFDGFLKVLNPRLSASDHVLLVLYQRGKAGANFSEIESWARPPMRRDLRRTLRRLTEERAMVHLNGTQYLITQLGMREVETRRLFEIVP